MRADNLFETITDQLIAAIEAGADDWRMPWHTLAEAGTPASVDGHRYRGVNALWLPMVAASEGWDSGLWATYRGWQRHSAQVRRGEKGTAVLLWKKLDPRADDTADNEDGAQPRGRLVARTFTVFAAEQADGTDELIAARQRTDRDSPERIDDAEAFFAAIGADVQVGGNVACYQPKTDTIRLPRIEQFDQAAHYYATQAHDPLSAPSRALVGASQPTRALCDRVQLTDWGVCFGRRRRRWRDRASRCDAADRCQGGEGRAA